MPLTDDQKKGMSDREIELWEAQARKGILNRDDTLRRLTSDLHSAVFADLELSSGGKINLLHLGIRTDRNLANFGELEIDEERLQHYMSERMDDVRELFTKNPSIPAADVSRRRNRLQESGVAGRINDILNWQLTHGGGIFDKAGLATGPSSEQNTLSRQILREDRRIEDMVRSLQRKEQRYYEQFGRLEAAMMSANSQMMFLESMLFGG